MTDYFIILYRSLGEGNTKYLGIRFHAGLRYIVRSTANSILPVYYLLSNLTFRQKLNRLDSNNPKIIVSLTSFPKRIDRLWIVIETLLRQTKKPDLIILWLSKRQFASLNSLPKRLLTLLERGLEIVFVDEDYCSHKKYYYVVREYPNDFVVTVDDDIFYSKYLIAELWNKHLEYPDAIVCNYAFQILSNDNKSLAPYLKWTEIRCATSPSSEMFFGSGGGTLFPPGSFHEDVLKIELFMKLCREADDIWLNTMVRLNNKKIAKANLYSTILPVKYKDDVTLSMTNIGAGQNDEQLSKVRDFYMQNQNRDPYNFEK